jgi:hypothetical protein
LRAVEVLGGERGPYFIWRGSADNCPGSVTCPAKVFVRYFLHNYLLGGYFTITAVYLQKKQLFGGEK